MTDNPIPQTPPQDAPANDAPAQRYAPGRRDDAWTLSSTLVAATTGVFIFRYLTTHLLFDRDWQPALIAVILALVAGIIWKQAAKLFLGGAAAVLTHQVLLMDGSSHPLAAIFVSALVGVAIVCVWRMVAVAVAATVTLVGFKLMQDGIAPELVLDAISHRFAWPAGL